MQISLYKDKAPIIGNMAPLSLVFQWNQFILSSSQSEFLNIRQATKYIPNT